jgi:hypothetical protein
LHSTPDLPDRIHDVPDGLELGAIVAGAIRLQHLAELLREPRSIPEKRKYLVSMSHGGERLREQGSIPEKRK